jgi:AcrR family transcriptional regulator
MKQETSIKKKTKAAETKNKIYQCADQLFREYGFEQVSVDSIVEKAGISKGAFYVHFDSKDALLAALITEYVSKLDFDYKSFSKFFPADAAASDILISLVEKIADNLACDIGYSLIKIAYRIQIDKTISTDMLLNHNREIYRTFSSLIDRGIQQGEFKTGIPAGVIADHFIMALRGFTYEWCIRYPDFNLKDQLHQHFEILLSGIKESNI